MKRSSAIVVFAIISGSVLLLAPAWTCPDCAAAALHSGFAPGCPRCADSGRISAFNRGTRRGLHPDLSVLVREPWMASGALSPKGFPEALRRLLEASSTTLRMGTEVIGHARFVDDGTERLPAVVLRSAFLAETHQVAVVLFDPGGRVLDLVEVGGSLPIQADWNSSGEVWVGSGPDEIVFLLWRGTVTSRIRGREFVVRPRSGKLDIVER